MKRTVSLLVGVGVLVLVAVAWSRNPKQPTVIHPRRSPAREAACVIAPGTRWSFDVDLTLTLAGHVTTYRQTLETVAVGGRILGELHGRGQTPLAPATRFAIEVEPSCRVASFEVNPEIDQPSLVQLRLLAEMVDVEIQQENHWTARHHDSSGDYVATYVRDGAEIVRDRRSTGRGQSDNRRTDQSGRAFIRLSDGWFSRLDAHDRVTLLGPVPAQAERALHFVRRPGGARLALSLDGLVDLFSLRPDLSEQSAPATTVVEITNLRDYMNHAATTGVAASQDATALGRAIQSNPALLGAARDAMLGPSPIDRSRWPTLLAALEAAGTPGAQQLLCDVAAGDDLDEGSRVLAVAALQGLASPTEATATSLDALLGRGPTDNVARTALLSVAGLASGRASDPVVSARLGAIADSAITATINRDPVLALDAIGARGGPRHVDLIASHLDSDSPEVRTAAIRASRAQSTDFRTRVLLPRLREESDPHAIVGLGRVLSGVLEQGTPEQREAVVVTALGAVERASNPQALIGLVELLGTTAGTDARVRDALLALFSRSSDVAVRRAIGRYLSARELATSMGAR